MSNNPALNPTTIVPTQGNPIALEAPWDDSESLDNQHLVSLSQEVRRLYTWLGCLAGFSLVLVGTLSGLAIWLKLEQQQLAQQVSSLTLAKAEVAQVKSLETQVSLLNQQVPKELSSQLKSTQDQLKKLQAQIKQVDAKAVTSEEMNENLLNALKNIRSDSPASNP